VQLTRGIEGRLTRQLAGLLQVYHREGAAGQGGIEAGGRSNSASEGTGGAGILDAFGTRVRYGDIGGRGGRRAKTLFGHTSACASHAGDRAWWARDVRHYVSDINNSALASGCW
jgi:hypothetical protein